MDICAIFDDKLGGKQFKKSESMMVDVRIITYYFDQHNIILDVLIDDQEIALTTCQDNLVYGYDQDDYLEMADEIVAKIEKVLDPKSKK